MWVVKIKKLRNIEDMGIFIQYHGFLTKTILFFFVVLQKLTTLETRNFNEILLQEFSIHNIIFKIFWLFLNFLQTFEI